MSRMDEYRHLDKAVGSCITVELSMEEVARIAIRKNYGLHRLLSAIVREKRAENERLNREYARTHPEYDHVLMDDELCAGIEALLNKGLY